MTTKPYTIVSVKRQIILDTSGTPVQGYKIDFTTASGFVGFVEMPVTRYSKEAAQQAVQAEAAKLEEIGLL